MPILLRKIVMWLFIISFFVITPIVILKASGYSYNWKKGALEKSGVLMIDIQPKSSKIFINGQELKQLFPFSAFHVEDLNPGAYNIRIEKDDYFSWEKNIEVKPNLTSFIDRVQLWPVSSAELITSIKIDHWFNLNKQYSIYSNQTTNYAELWLFNNETAVNKLIYRFIDKDLNNIEKSNFKTSANNKYLSFQYNGGNYIFSLLNPDEGQNLNQNHPDLKIANLHWDSNDDNSLYFSDTENNIYEAKINAPDFLELFNKLDENVIDFNIIDKYIYFIDEEKNFKRKNVDSSESEEILSLKNETYSIEEIDAEHWFIHDNDHSYFFQLYNNKVYYQTIPGREIVFSNDEKKLAYVNPRQFEILTLEKFREQPENAETFLLNRYSELAENLIWFSNNEYIFYKLNNNIEVIELDGRGNSRNINNLYTSPNSLRGFSIDKKAEKLFVANEDGIYALEIVD